MRRFRLLALAAVTFALTACGGTGFSSQVLTQSTSSTTTPHGPPTTVPDLGLPATIDPFGPNPPAPGPGVPGPAGDGTVPVSSGASAGPSADGPAVVAAAAPAAAPGETTSGPPAGPTGSTGAPEPQPAVPVAPPAPRDPLEGWQRCQNRTLDYSISYPPAWQTDGSCVYFAPGPVEAPRRASVASAPFVALQLRDRSPSALVPDSTTDIRTLWSEPRTIDGRQAVRYEGEIVVSRDLPLGTRLYGYRIHNNGRVFEVSTARLPGGSDAEYQARKALVDLAVKTLDFED